MPITGGFALFGRFVTRHTLFAVAGASRAPLRPTAIVVDLGAAVGAAVSVRAHDDLFARAMSTVSARARCALLVRISAAIVRRVLRLLVLAA